MLIFTIYNAFRHGRAYGEVLIRNPDRLFGLAVRTLPMSLSLYIIKATWKEFGNGLMLPATLAVMARDKTPETMGSGQLINAFAHISSVPGHQFIHHLTLS